tara:strand:- start:4088 stop:4462 length:375 start_codon:yes stop_codon:yes gene_type:complete
MGLDQYAYKIKRSYNDETLTETIVKTEIANWRKHNALEGYMADLYSAKTGDKSEFNCKTLKLNESDIDNLGKAVRDNKLPNTQGFFFGQPTEFDEEQKEKDLNFIAKAKDCLESGYELEYYSWW